MTTATPRTASAGMPRTAMMTRAASVRAGRTSGGASTRAIRHRPWGDVCFTGIAHTGLRPPGKDRHAPGSVQNF
eukprot:5968147-Prymnesium_polylepis.1